MKTIRLLTADEIEVKIKQVTEKGAVALLYKTARVDMAILDETYGPENWTNDYKEIKENLYCGIGVRTSEEKPFVWKWDCGIESRQDGDGNEKKGEASDAFKRAGFKWGIGRELYTAPFTFLKVETKNAGTGTKGRNVYVLKNPFEKFSVKEIGYDDQRRIKALTIADDKGKVVYVLGEKAEPAPEKEILWDIPTPQQTTVRRMDVRQQCIVDLIKGTSVAPREIAEMVRTASAGKTNKVAELTDKQFEELCGVIRELTGHVG